MPNNVDYPSCKTRISVEICFISQHYYIALSRYSGVTPISNHTRGLF